MARAAVMRLQSALVERREQETPRYLAAAAQHAQKLRVGGVYLLDIAHVLLFTRRLITIAAWLLALALASGWLTFALAVAYPYLPGAQTEAFKGVSVLVGLMATVGASSVVGQAFNGLILMYTRSFPGIIRVPCRAPATSWIRWSRSVTARRGGRFTPCWKRRRGAPRVFRKRRKSWPSRTGTRRRRSRLPSRNGIRA